MACVRSLFGKNQCHIMQCTGTTERKLRPSGAQPDIIVDHRSFYSILESRGLMGAV
jgi:hypothetical protein